MGINRVLLALLFALAAASAQSREAATPAQCKALAAQPRLSEEIAKARSLNDVRAQMTLADAWSDAGCFDEAVAQLQAAVAANPGVPELQTRLRVANSLIGEERFFDDLDRADLQAKLKRDSFRCRSLSDLDACREAARLQPVDPAPQIALGDALMRTNRPLEALQQYRRAETAASDKQDLLQKMHAAEAQSTASTSGPTSADGNSSAAKVVRTAPEAAPRRYTNIAPVGQSH